MHRAEEGVTALGPSGNGSGSGNENPYLTFSHSVPAQVHLVAALGGLANRDAPRLFAPLLVPGTPIDVGPNRGPGASLTSTYKVTYPRGAPYLKLRATSFSLNC